MFIFIPRECRGFNSDTIRRVFMRPVVSQSQHAVARGRKIARCMRKTHSIACVRINVCTSCVYD